MTISVVMLNLGQRTRVVLVCRQQRWESRQLIWSQPRERIAPEYVKPNLGSAPAISLNYCNNQIEEKLLLLD